MSHAKSSSVCNSNRRRINNNRRRRRIRFRRSISRKLRRSRNIRRRLSHRYRHSRSRQALRSHRYRHSRSWQAHIHRLASMQRHHHRKISSLELLRLLIPRLPIDKLPRIFHYHLRIRNISGSLSLKCWGVGRTLFRIPPALRRTRLELFHPKRQNWLQSMTL